MFTQRHQVPSKHLEQPWKDIGTQENGFMGQDMTASEHDDRGNNYTPSSVGTKMLSFCFTCEMKGKKHHKH